MSGAPPPRLGPVLRLQASGAARRLYPARVGVALADVRAARLWRRQDAREQALRDMELLVGRTSRAGELERLARAHLAELCRYEELAWRTDLITSRPVDHVERLREQVDAGKGVILSVVHQGHFGAHPACLSRYGFAVSPLVAPTLIGEQPRTPRGVRRRQLYRTFDLLPTVTPVNAAGSYGRVRSLLQDGGTVLLACDMKGSTPVRFLGRTVRVPSGTARLSLETGAPVLPVSVRPDGHLERLEVQQAVRPEDHDCLEALLQAVFDRHEPAVLAWPEGYERPSIHFEEVAAGAPSA